MEKNTASPNSDCRNSSKSDSQIHCEPARPGSPSCVSSLPNAGTDSLDLPGVLRTARTSFGWSRKELAGQAGLATQTVIALEQGGGRMTSLVAVLLALDIRIVGIGQGGTIADQLRNRRNKRSITVAALATQTGLSRANISSLESGKGSVASLLRVLPVLAPKARKANAKSGPNPVDKLDPDSRFTPPNFMENIYAAFGPVDLDPCAHRQSAVKAKRCIYKSEGGDGLKENWVGQFVFVNPPFSDINIWLQRAYAQWKGGYADLIACLVPYRADTRFFHETLLCEASVFQYMGRVKFGTPSGGSHTNFQPLMLIVFGATAEQKRRYASRASGSWLMRWSSQAAEPSEHTSANREVEHQASGC